MEKRTIALHTHDLIAGFRHPAVLYRFGINDDLHDLHQHSHTGSL